MGDRRAPFPRQPLQYNNNPRARRKMSIFSVKQQVENFGVHDAENSLLLVTLYEGVLVFYPVLKFLAA
jgi:hypothetical protein